ncbi:MAG: SusC/RagA family TonB-linked outer membrane protein, partial [Marinoscillum sp.]
TLYRANSFDQIFQTDVTAATGRRVDVVNAGEIQNQGIEASLRLTPVKSGDFKWDMNINWAKNVNEVISLYGDQTNLQLGTSQGGISLNATVGEPFGTIRGTNYQFDDQGRPIVYAHPFGGVRFRKTAAPEVIGDINPDWIGGVQNTLSYKGVALSFLIDMQKGGDFFSLDTWYGYATGIYDITAGTNADGNPRRDLPAEGGGIYLSELDYFDNMVTVSQATDSDGAYVFDDDGNPVSSGEVNTEAFYVSDVYNSLGYAIAPNSTHIYDASFVKLRELSISYSFPESFVSNTPFGGIDVSLIGRNLWIIHKNTPYSDPESGLSAGNRLGYQSGAYPAVKEYGFNIGLKF